jgi:predicted DNA-binding protein
MGRGDKKQGRRSGRPPAGARPGEKVKDYPQVSLRIPPSLKSQLYALSILRSKPQWRVMIDAIECLMRELPDSERRMVHEIARRSGR